MSIIYRVRNEIANPITNTRPNVKTKTQPTFNAQQAFNIGTKIIGFANIVNNIQQDEQTAWVATENVVSFTNLILLPTLLDNTINKVDDILLKSTNKAGSDAVNNLSNTKQLALKSRVLKSLKYGIPVITQIALTTSSYYRKQNQINRNTRFQKQFTGALINKR